MVQPLRAQLKPPSPLSGSSSVNFPSKIIKIKPPRWFELIGVLVSGLLVLLLLTPHVVEWLNPPTGDEPFYLVTAISLIKDHDLEEFNNYYNYDFWDFAPTCEEMAKAPWGYIGSGLIDSETVRSIAGIYAPGLRNCRNTPPGLTELLPHYSKNTVREGIYTKHGIGLSVLIVPAYALGGRIGVVIFLNFLAALVGLNCWLLAWEMTGKRKIAWLVWAAMLFTSPLLPFAFLIFPALPAALLVIYSWRRLRLVAQARLLVQEKYGVVAKVNGWGRALLIGLCLGFLPWLHSVFLSISLPLFLYFLLGGRVRYWRVLLPGWSAVTTALLLLPIIILGGLFLAYYIYLYGTPFPNTQDHAGFAPLYYIWLGIFGFFFDQKYGLLIYAPGYLLAFVGLILLSWRSARRGQTNRRRSDLIWLGLVIIPNFLVMSSYNQWWGEWGSPARYLVPLVPLLAAPLAVVLAEAPQLFTRLFFGLSLLWSVTISVAWMLNPHLMFHWQDQNPAKLLTWLQLNLPFFKDVKLAGWFPSYVTNLKANGGQPTILAGIVWLSAAGIIVALASFLALRKHPKREEIEIWE
ncbi:MAG: hypothetical protein HXX20_15855 [Chloroflexi bacterium]|nr:hypothetical protein [Chloroflexota bacterium]